MATKSKKQYIAPAEQSLAALYFTLSNTAMLHYVQRGDLIDAYYRANSDLVAEVGIGLREEKQDWEKFITKGDPYVFEEWNRVRADYVK